MKISIDLKYKYKKLLKYLLIFIFLCILLFYINEFKVNAASVPSSCIFYDNNGSSLSYQPTNVGRDNSGNISYYSTENSFTLTAGSYGGLIVCSLDTPVLKDKLYTLSVNFDLPGAVSTLSRKSILGLGANDNDARNNYISSTGVDIKSASSNNSVLSYVFVPNVNANYIAIPFGSTTTVSTTPYLRNLTISYQGDTNQLTSNDIQSIIDKSNQDLTNSIDSGLNNCYQNIIPHDNYISSTGEVVINGSNDSTQWLKLGTLTLNPGNYTSIANTGNSDISLVIDELRNYDTSTTKQFTLTSSVLTNVFIRVSPGTYNNVKFKPAIMTGFTSIYSLPGQKSCTSKIDDTNKNLNDLKDDISNSNSSGATSDASSFFNNFTTEDNGGISSIITAPLRMINSLISNSGSCNDLSLKLNMVSIEKDVSIPCGSILWSKASSSTITIYHTIVYGLAAFVILRDLYKQIEDIKNPTDKGVKTTDL